MLWKVNVANSQFLLFYLLSSCCSLINLRIKHKAWKCCGYIPAFSTKEAKKVLVNLSKMSNECMNSFETEKMTLDCTLNKGASRPLIMMGSWRQNIASQTSRSSHLGFYQLPEMSASQKKIFVILRNIKYVVDSLGTYRDQ